MASDLNPRSAYNKVGSIVQQATGLTMAVLLSNVGVITALLVV
jgi:hypothetical protein